MPPRHFASLELQGPDAADFLQGYLTADLKQIDDGSALPMAYCNIKGRVHASGWVFGRPESVRLLVHASVVDDLRADLARYLMFAKSTFAGPAAGVRFSPQASAGAVRLPPTGFHAVVDVATDATDESHAVFADACVRAGVVVVSAGVSQMFLPQMIGLTDLGAVSFSKGCYLGQEVVARAEHRGAVKQRLRRYRFAGEPPLVGADLSAAGKKVGTVVAVGDGIALGASRAAASVVAVGDQTLAAIESDAGTKPQSASAETAADEFAAP